MRPDILKRFLTNTDETGRFLMKSGKTGIICFVKLLYNGKTPEWGDVDPATQKNTGCFKASPLGETDRWDQEHLKQLRHG